MTPAHYRALGRVFAAEIENRLPYQPRKPEPPTYGELVEEYGYLEYGELEYPGRTIVQGYFLTHAGRLAYCEEAVRKEQRRIGYRRIKR